MLRFLLSIAILSSLAAPALADETLDKLRANPDSVDAIDEYLQANFVRVFDTLHSDPVATERALAEIKGVLDGLKTKNEDAQATIGRGKKAIESFYEQVELARVKLEDVEKQLEANPNDLKLYTRYIDKLTSDYQRVVYFGDPDEAEKMLKSARNRVLKVLETTKNDKVKDEIDRFPRQIVSLAGMLDRAKERASLVGKSSIPLDAIAWVNGSPLTDADLKGKVVLLDFWAVWCGPCIRTFPHLVEWNEKYAGKGLVIVGLTKYYNFEWDEAKHRGKPAEDDKKVSPEAEQAMLKKFAAHHKLGHRIAISPEESKLDEYYRVAGLPHIVVIDRAGKIRLVRAGTGPENTKAIQALIEKLLAE